MKEPLIAILLTISINAFAPVVSDDYSRNRDKELHKEIVDQESKRQQIVYYKSVPFNKEDFFEYLKLKTEHYEIAYRQAILETGWFSHIRCTKYNNYFGMKEAKVREHRQKGVWKDHATYEHWTDSADDYVLWAEYWAEYFDQSNYYDFLNDVGYATASRYVQTLKTLTI